MENKANPQGILLRLALLINMLSVGTLMMVMPLGPDLVRDIGLAGEQIGLISGGATLGSAVIGFLVAPYLDRYERKKALILFLIARSVLILLCSWSESSQQLIATFILAGCFSGPLSGLVMASVIDATKVEERGKAMAFVASGFSLAAILVVPASLFIAQWFSWQIAFVLSGVLGLLLSAGLLIYFPSSATTSPSQKTVGHNQQAPELKLMLLSLPFILSICMTGIAMFGHFLLVPNISTYFQFNLAFPREEISYLYFLGGIASILAMRWSGKLLDKGYLKATLFGLSLLVAVVVYSGFIFQPQVIVIYLIFILFMASSAARSAMVTALVSRCPPPHFRAAFMSYQSTASNIAAGIASMVSSQYLSTGADNQLVGVEQLAVITIFCSLVIPIFTVFFLSSVGPKPAMTQLK